MTSIEPAASSPADAGTHAAVRQAVEDYYLGWYDADPGRMERAIHPDLAKRSHVEQGGEPRSIRAVTAAQMIGWTGDGEGREADPAGRRLAIHIDEIHDSIATVHVRAAKYVEYLHLARTPAGWRIVNALWQEP
jgi:hypothetical protein